MDTNAKDQIERLFSEVIARLVEADGGELHLVRWDGDDVHIHLSGACAGCPGASLTSDGVILPAIRSVSPKARVILTTGVRAPEGARKI
jgi:Fe-S cluster biogenesis protein NfuA